MEMPSFENVEASKKIPLEEILKMPDRDKNPEAYQYYTDHFLPPKEDREFKIENGKKYEKRATSWSIDSFFHHPGPGWDARDILREFGVSTAFLDDLPETPFYDWYFVESIKE